MRKLLIILFTLVINISVGAPPIVGGFGTDMDRLMVTEYPNWWVLEKEDRETIERMFVNSPNKHWWFPDKYPEPGYNYASIRPKKRL